MASKGGAFGYATLVVLTAGGFLGGLVLGGLGLYAYFAASDLPVRNTTQGRALLASLESALVLWSFGVLSLLVGVVAFTVLLKGLSDDVSSARRGPV
ncbi:MAG TPA: hypothetical protein VFF73_42455 [Planctomycetota bacterium]|nr:hypothetical protein [Planctomycetota bacterium]